MSKNAWRFWGASAMPLLFAICCVTTVAEAATVSLNKNSDNGFVAADGWNSGEEPKSGNDYIVANGYFLRGDNSQGFAGDSLQFGIVGGTEGIFYKEHAGTHTFTKLILANGYYRTWMSRAGQEAHICGAVEVTSPESAPFRLHSTHNSGAGWWITYWDAAITGAEGTGLKVGPYPNALLSAGQTIFTGDNSAYLGSITVYGTNAVFAFTTGNSLGGALSSFKADALSLCDGTTLESRGADVTLAASLNRGIFVNETGGRISVPAGNALRVEWPISGSGTLKKIGEGTLTLASAMSQTVPFVIDGTGIMLASGFSNSGNSMISVPRGGEICVKPGDEVEVRNLVLEGGAIRLSYDANAAQSGVLVLGEGCEPNWPIPVYTLSTRGLKIPFLKVPTSMKTVTAADFVKPDDFAATGLPSATFTVETEGTVQTVYAEMVGLVTVSETFNGSANDRAYLTYGGDKERWTDGQLPHSGADYRVQGGKTLYTQAVSSDYTFPGESLSFAGASGSTAAVQFNNSGATRFSADIRTYDYVKFYPQKSASGSDLHIDGRLYVGSTQGVDNGLDFRAAANDITTVIDSVVSGSGYMCFQPGSSNRTNTYVFASDDNTYTGTYFLYGGEKANSHTVLKFANAGSWGHNPPSSRADNMTIQGGSSSIVELHPLGSQTLDMPNREFLFKGSGVRFRVDDGEVFELSRSLLKFRRNGVTKKIGGGTWAVGGAVSVVDSGDTPTLEVAEGYLRADNARAFVDLSVTVAEGAGIAAKYRPGDTSEVATYGMIVTNAARFAMSGNTLKFKVTTNGEKVRSNERVAILTVPEESATAIAAKTIAFEHDDAYGRYPELLMDSVTVSGMPCVRYSCKFIRGTKFIVR